MGFGIQAIDKKVSHQFCVFFVPFFFAIVLQSADYNLLLEISKSQSGGNNNASISFNHRCVGSFDGCKCAISNHDMVIDRRKEYQASIDFTGSVVTGIDVSTPNAPKVELVIVI